MSSKTVIWACLGARVQRCMRPIDWEIHSADTAQTMLCPWRRHLELSPHVSQEGVRMGPRFTPRSNIQLEMSGYFSWRHRKGVLKGHQNSNKKNEKFFKQWKSITFGLWNHFLVSSINLMCRKNSGGSFDIMCTISKCHNMKYSYVPYVSIMAP